MTYISQKTVQNIRNFVKDRHWNQFHNPKDLAISVNLEAAELLEVFQWSGADLTVEKKKDRLEEEIADVLIYTILLAEKLGLNAEEILNKKIQANAAKYPVEKARDNAKKYTEYGE